MIYRVKLQTIKNNCNKTMKKSLIMNIIIILTLLLIAGFFYNQNQNYKNEIDTLNKRIEELEKGKSKPISEKLPEGWKEYTNTRYNFRISYPKEVNLISSKKIAVSVNEGIYDIGYLIFFSDSADYMKEGVPPSLFRISIYNEEMMDIKTFTQKEARESIINNNITNIEQYLVQVKINNIDANKFDTPNGDLRYYIKKNNLIFTLWLPGSVYLKEDLNNIRPIFDQMVKSFKFIE